MPISLSGSLELTGSLTVTGGITMSGSIASASYATNAELLDGLDSTVFTSTASFAAQTASFTAFTASLNTFSASILSYTSSLNAKTSSFATTGSNIFIGTQTLTGSIVQSGNYTTTGTIIAQSINVQQVTSSIVYSCGSNNFGTAIGNTQVFTGSMFITGSNITANVGNACFASQVCVTGNADTSAGLVINNPSGNSGTCQHYINFTAGATTIARMFRGNGVTGLNSNGLTIDNFDGMNIRLNQLGGSGGFLGISGGVACFSSTVCAPTIISTGQICSLMVNTGCVGIGTATPSSALQIYRTAYTGNQFKTYAELQAAPTTLCYTTSDGFGLILNMYEAISGAPYTRYADIVANTGDISNSAMRFFTKAASVNATEKMRITPEGDVGIGTAGGTYGKFTVDASNQSYTIAAIGNDQTSARIRIKNTGASGGDYAWIVGVNNVGNAGFSLLDITNSATRLTIASTGAATFACQICTTALVTADLRYTGTGYITYDTSASGTSCLIIRQDATERMRISECGYVAVTGNQALSCVPYLQGMSFGWNRSNGQGESMINWTNAGGGTTCDLTFNFRDSSTLYERLRIASTGAATFSNTITTANNSGTSVNITTNGNNGTSASPLQTNVNFYGYNGNLNGQIRVDDIAGTAQIGTMKFYTWNSAQVLALTLAHTGAATFYSKVLVNSAIDDAASALQIKVLSANSTSARIASTTNNNLFSFISNDTPGHAILDMGKYTESGTYASGYIRLRTDGNSWIQGGNVGIGCTTPKTRVFVLGLAGGQVGAGGCGCSAYSGGGKPAIYSYYGDQFGNGAPYGASAGTIAPYDVWYGGGAGGYFKGGDGDPSPGGGGAGIVAIGGNGSTYADSGAPFAEGGAGIYAKGGFNKDGTTRTWAGYFDGCVYACGITTSDFVNVSAASSAYYGLKVAGVSGAARSIFLAGQVGYSNGFTVDYTGTAMKYSFIDGNVGIGTTSACSILDVRGTITNGSTAGSNSTIDVSPAKQSIASGGYVDFPSMSGMIVVNDWTDGTITIFLAGGGSTSPIGSAAGQAGALYYNLGVAGYRWCNNKGYTGNFGFLVFKTRPTA